MKTWLIINRHGQVIGDTDDLDQAWSICEVCTECTVIKNKQVR
jgi:hypothetical protein